MTGPGQPTNFLNNVPVAYATGGTANCRATTGTGGRRAGSAGAAHERGASTRAGSAAAVCTNPTVRV